MKKYEVSAIYATDPYGVIEWHTAYNTDSLWDAESFAEKLHAHNAIEDVQIVQMISACGKPIVRPTPNGE